MYGINDGEKLKATKLCNAIILRQTFLNKANLRKNKPVVGVYINIAIQLIIKTFLRKWRAIYAIYSSHKCMSIKRKKNSLLNKTLFQNKINRINT